MTTKRILTTLGLSFAFAFTQTTLSHAENISVTNGPAHQLALKESAKTSEEIKKSYAEKNKELDALKARFKELQENDPEGDCIVNEANKDSFYAKTSIEFITHIAELSKEIYYTGETDKEEIQKKYDEKKQLTETELKLLLQKQYEYINLNEDIQKGAMSPDNFMLVVRARFGSFVTSNIDFNDLDTKKSNQPHLLKSPKTLIKRLIY
jgi:outer membrane receptor for ferric coprogen and ferric-rhodotorulic acid